MINLPKGFPMYCIDLKQELDRRYPDGTIKILVPFNIESYGIATVSNTITKWKLIPIEEHPNYPKQTNEHSAIDDARWNKKLYEFLNTL